MVNHDYLEEHFDGLDPVISHRMVKGRQLSAVDYLSTWRQWQSLRERVRQRLKGFGRPDRSHHPYPLRPLKSRGPEPRSYYATNARYLRNTFIGNILNFCAVSLPCGFTRRGLPIGLMIYAQPFKEGLALRIAWAYEQATDWHCRHPDLPGSLKA